MERFNRAAYGVSCCREPIAVAVAQIDRDPVVCDSFVDPTLKIAVANIEKIIALKRAAHRYPMAHKNAEDLTANVRVGRSIMHGSTIGFDRRCSYARAATVDKIAQPMGNVAGVGAACRWINRT